MFLYIFAVLFRQALYFSNYMTTEHNPKIVEYLQSVKERIHPSQLEGYLPVNDIIIAFTKGEEHGKNAVFEQLKDNVTNQLAQHFLYTENILKDLIKNNFYIESFYISAVKRRTIFITTLENTVNDNFIDYFYDQAFLYESRFKQDYDSSIHFSFISNENIDEEELECDYFRKFNLK